MSVADPFREAIGAILEGKSGGRCLLHETKRDQPRKAQRVAWLCSDFARCVGWRPRDLVGHHFDERGNAGELLIDFQRSCASLDIAPLLIT